MRGSVTVISVLLLDSNREEYYCDEDLQRCIELLSQIMNCSLTDQDV